MMINSAWADWAYRFVVNEGKTYMVSDQHVQPEHTGSKIGRVTFYSDQEGTYAGNVSNYFPKGTEYFLIKDVDIHKAIAVKASDGSFIQANYKGEYKGNPESWSNILPYVFGGMLLIIVIFILINNWRSSRN
jgi:hypothetical protein